MEYVFPQFDDFPLEPQIESDKYIRLNWLQKGAHDYVFGPEQLSDGSLRFIALATLLLSPSELLPNVIIIDESELHPQAIDDLAAMMREARRFSQIIAATQSERILDNFTSENVIVEEKDATTGASAHRHLDGDALKDWLEDYSLSELWGKNILGGQP